MLRVAGVGAAEAVGADRFLRRDCFIRRPLMTTDRTGNRRERIEPLDRAVARQRNRHACVDELPERISPFRPLRAEALRGPGVAGDELRLKRRDDLALRHSLQTIGRRDRLVLDAMAMDDVGLMRKRELDSTYGLAHRLIA